MLGEQYKSKYTVMARINGGLVIIVKSMNDYLEFSLSAKYIKPACYKRVFFVVFKKIFFHEGTVRTGLEKHKKSQHGWLERTRKKAYYCRRFLTISAT